MLISAKVAAASRPALSFWVRCVDGADALLGVGHRDRQRQEDEPEAVAERRRHRLSRGPQVDRHEDAQVVRSLAVRQQMSTKRTRGNGEEYVVQA